jgi:putative membrane protein
MIKRSPIQYGLLTLKGIAMGAADVVPGVSGGTIAFISGIYEELIDSINKINLDALKTWKNLGFKHFWNHINGTFFIFLFAGIIISVVSLAKIVSHLLETYPVLLWSFFFGLIIASVWLIIKSLDKWSPGVLVLMCVGALVAYYFTTINSVASIDGAWYIVLSGAIAICAMILPGISGAFILLLLGSYDKVLSAINDKDSVTIALFGLGCIIGLFSFARLLKYLFNRFKNLTVAVLAGFMVGSLNKVWPWKETVSTRLNSHGELVPFIQENVLPINFSGESQLMYAVMLACGGFLCIFILEKFASKES